MKKIKVLHIIYQLSTGGLENGLVNLINHLPSDQFDHAILSLSYSTNFKNRIIHPNCEIIDLNKEPGPLLLYFRKILNIIKAVKPDIVHTRNLSALECQIVAWFAGVPVRVHSEHGREPNDVDGDNKKNQLIRKVASPFVQKYIALSKELEGYLIEKISISPDRVVQIYNGVDSLKFSSKDKTQSAPFKPEQSHPINIIAVGRLQAVKNFQSLIEAALHLIQTGCDNFQIQIIGDGAEKENLQQQAKRLGVDEYINFLGNRNDVAELLLESDIFVLPSVIEGVSNTILEAMSCGLPIVASNVGGNPELVIDQRTGFLFESKNSVALAQALGKYFLDENMRLEHGMNSRKRVEQQFSLDRMVLQYQSTYQQLIKDKMHKCVA
tara:strand:- start:37294 stop:38436 length:1143 start_codon:yes stop_codon:yes gene_type:complete